MWEKYVSSGADVVKFYFVLYYWEHSSHDIKIFTGNKAFNTFLFSIFNAFSHPLGAKGKFRSYPRLHLDRKAVTVF